MMHEKTFREQVVDKFRAVFGEPEVSTFRSGALYRWTLPRDAYSISMFITIDSPEFSDVAHVMISDGAASQIEPVVSITVHTLDETESVIERIFAQWRGSAT